MFKTWPYLIIMKMMSHLQLILSKIGVRVGIIYPKHVIHCYIKPLVFKINQSLIEGVFPDELKLAKVIPVVKAGSSMELSNYRPISVKKILQKSEKLMYNSMVSYFDKYHILYENQFSFRQGHSSTMLLLLWLTKLLSHLIQETW